MLFPISLLVSPVLLLNTATTNPVLPSEVEPLAVETYSPTPLDYSYRYNRKGENPPSGGTGRRRIMA
ncbi:hypothetical protein [Roseofilum casamattae]|uniref:Uncharacterized protein n=1 Tax=Roseofilum casamattae BLCC-M143 TaxID=3022442 RepID=A0ABT7C3W3_9CYAN|nr:hypothetical protein [Roseofilum casamattae]MDJ1185451.1 hypothetical protein [Roseofilum casamattae BLCC-M143]